MDIILLSRASSCSNTSLWPADLKVAETPNSTYLEMFL